MPRKTAALTPEDRELLVKIREDEKSLYTLVSFMPFLGWILPVALYYTGFPPFIVGIACAAISIGCIQTYMFAQSLKKKLDVPMDETKEIYTGTVTRIVKSKHPFIMVDFDGTEQMIPNKFLNAGHIKTSWKIPDEPGETWTFERLPNEGAILRIY